jgi:hypothetical protein
VVIFRRRADQEEKSRRKYCTILSSILIPYKPILQPELKNNPSQVRPQISSNFKVPKFTDDYAR